MGLLSMDKSDQSMRQGDGQDSLELWRGCNGCADLPTATDIRCAILMYYKDFKTGQMVISINAAAMY